MLTVKGLRRKYAALIFLLLILLSNQNCGNMNFGVNFGPLIQPNSISSLHSFVSGRSGLHCSIRINVSGCQDLKKGRSCV